MRRLRVKRQVEKCTSLSRSFEIVMQSTELVFGNINLHLKFGAYLILCEWSLVLELTGLNLSFSFQICSS